MDEILELLQKSYSATEYEFLKRAFDYARKAHQNQKRASGEEYFTHPCAVAKILVDLGMDSSAVAAAFLHDVIEDTPVSEGDIQKEFGAEVLELVVGVTKLEKIEFKSFEEEQAENFKKIFVSMAKDIRVIIIKLADRLHNMRSLNFLSQDRQKRMARETLDIYAPIASRLGISQIARELEDLCLKYLDPEAYEYLSININLKLEERQQFVSFVVSEIQKILDEGGIKGEVFGRPKHFYSIYRKMKNQDKALDQIYDLTAVRAIVPTIDDCYEVLGKIHKKWKPIPGRIKDYIATPKPNMYQSLHTTVVTNFGQVFEIQIRTYEMNNTAEYGIAAHWKYKENKAVEDNFDKKLSWIRNALEWEGGIKSTEFVANLKDDITNTEVLVFTPKGDVISLPTGATPIDFAYNIHTAIGNKCVGAKVNGKMVPLNTELHVGDVVEVMTASSSKGPSWDWLKIVKSPSSRAKIKQFFKHEMKDEHIKIGKSMLESEAKSKGYVWSELMTAENFEKLSARMSFSSSDEMYASVGCGAVTVNQVIIKLIDYVRKEAPKIDLKRQFVAHKVGSSEIIVKGLSGLLVRFAACCNPVPGDKIVGFLSRGRGVSIHRADCPNLKDAPKERLIETEWSEQAGSNYVSAIKVTANDQATALSAVSAVTAALNLVIISVNGRMDVKHNVAQVDVTVRLNSKDDVDNLIKKLSDNPSIIDVYRTAT